MLSVQFLLIASALTRNFFVSASSWCDEAGWSRVFEEEFTGTSLNHTVWNVLNSTVYDDSSCRTAMCLEKNVAVTGGNLVLTAKREHSGWANWTTGAVNTQDKIFWKAEPGKPFRVCTSVLSPGNTTQGSAGLWPASWLMPNTKACWPSNGEIDLFEMINGDGVAHSSYHVSPPGTSTCGKAVSTTAQKWVGTNSYHEYAVQSWTDGRASSYVFAIDGTVRVDPIYSGPRSMLHPPR
jgi:beta-glucanase (GH16 family)